MGPEFSGERLGSRMEQVWNQCKVDPLGQDASHENILTCSIGRKKGRLALLCATCKFIRRPLITAIVPRLCLIGFKFAQPFLLNRAVSYVAEKQANPGSMHKAIGYGLIGSTALIYLGLAVRT